MTDRKSDEDSGDDRGNPPYVPVGGDEVDALGFLRFAQTHFVRLLYWILAHLVVSRSPKVPTTRGAAESPLTRWLRRLHNLCWCLPLTCWVLVPRACD